MNQVLYRKYRAQNFAEIRGQEHVVPILVESILQNKVSHAYLFSGPRGTGKTSIARLMAKSINCENFADHKDVCNACIYCESINSGNNVDIIEMDAASNRGIEEIRSLKDTVNFLPNFLKKKVYIIDEAHMLTKEAFNALLKTLEEPPSHVVFILATTEAHKLPVTILSRVTRFDFKFGSLSDVLDKLNYIAKEEGINIDPKGLEVIYKYSGGSFRDSESLLGKIILYTSKAEITLEDINKAIGIVSDKVISELLNTLLSKDKKSLISILDQIFTNEANVNIILEQLLSEVGNLILKNITDDKSIIILNNLAKNLLNIKADLRDFSDKALIFKIELLRIISEEATVSENRLEIKKPEVKVEQPKVKTEAPVASSTKESTEHEAQKPVEASVQTKPELKNDINYFKTTLLEEGEKVSPRLKAILKSSSINLLNNTLTISNSSKLNINYLSKKENREVIFKVIGSVFNTMPNVQFSVEESKQESVDEKDVVVEQKPKVDYNSSRVEVKSDIVDNSGLVESLF